ncbi:hypothetical protein LCGC14_2258830 [marine sediment metagenome]|uniref:Uncharacterized protein n=1 Tax=marine sediment metagenome TaxID=412755 RepID=A0A0F9D0L7_9ZZZZ
MTQPLRIGIDIDGVLASGFHEAAAKYLGKPKDWLPDQWNYGMKWEKLGILLDQIFSIEDLWRCSPAKTENCEVLANFLTNHIDDMELFYITARRQCRGWMSLQRQTRFWLGQQGLYQSNCTLLIVGEKAPKAKLIGGLGIEFSLDDHLKVVEEVNAVPFCNSFLLDAPYNRPRPSTIHVVRNVAEYLGEIEKWLVSIKQSPQS